jgi:DNA invertase Pin-like site-specific DNA recombinase
MIYGYARVSTDGQSVAAQVNQLKTAGCEKMFLGAASGTRSGRTELRKALEHPTAGDVLMVARLDRPARSTREIARTYNVSHSTISRLTA